MKLLVAEDEKLLRMNLCDALAEAGYQVVSASNGAEAWSLIETQRPSLVIADVRMPGMDGIELLRRVRTTYPSTEVVIMTTYASVRDAVTTLKEGAADYLVKPFEMDEFMERVAHVVEVIRLRQRTRDLEKQVHRLSGKSIFLGTSPAMQEVWRQVQRLAVQEVDVLIEGETGTGKEVVARTLHEQSARSSGPFVPVSFAGLPAALVENELFGHERGAFTGADRSRPGRVEAAHGGTLFLDDVDDIPMEMQGKLLRVLQERKVERLGSTLSRPVDFRLISASKRDLNAMLEEGQFRRDLYYRLHVVHLKLPPLRRRREEILPMAGFFLKKFCEGRPHPIPTLGPAAAALLQRYDWPGNVREIQHTLQSAVAFCEGKVIQPEHLPEEIHRSVGLQGESPSLPEPGGVSLEEALRETERRLLTWAMEKAQGNQSQAASLLGIARSTFQYRWAKMVDRGREESSS